MKRFYNFLLVLIVPSILISYAWFPSGSPGGKTGSIGDEGATCHSCHDSFEVESKIDWITSNIPDEGYTPGETYIITATGTHDGVVTFGFELTAEDNIGTKRGALAVTDAERTKFTNSDGAITHTSNGITPMENSNTWSMEWTAPDGEFGDITFYAAFNAGNGAGGTAGDQIYTSSLTAKLSTVGIGDDLLASRVSVYPNPANDFLYVNLPDGAEVRVVDMLGHQLISREQTNQKERLDISKFDSGIYFIQVIHEGNAATMRFMKN